MTVLLHLLRWLFPSRSDQDHVSDATRQHWALIDSRKGW
jgi:hypothetical protein